MTTALRLLSYRDRSVREVEERLRLRGFSPEEIGPTLKRLMEGGYLDDERFAKNTAEMRGRTKNWGPGKIAMELSSKGISREIAAAVLSQIDGPGEAEVARRELRSWARKTKTQITGNKGFARAYRHLLARGFSSHVIMELLRKPDPGDA